MATKSKFATLPVVFVLLMLGSCILDSRLISPTHGIVQVEIAENLGAVTRADNEVMNTIRLIVFTDLGTTPRAEINTLYTGSEGGFTVEPSTGGAPPKVRFTLKVERKESGANEKLVVAVINEPSAMKSGLDAVGTPADLENLELEMAGFVTDDHLSLKGEAMIPMTGALWTDQLFRTEIEASLAGNVLALEVQRAVARVDVYLKKGTDVESDMKMAAGSSVKLENTYTKSNFLMHSDGSNTLGSIRTVTSGFVDKSWSYTATTPQAISETAPVCVFYTPERNHTANRLKLTIDVKTHQGASRSGVLEITEACDADNTLHQVDVIQRNHIYKVIATIGANEITAEVRDWKDQNLTTDF